MQLGSMFISNCNNTLHVSDAICFRGSHRPWTPYWTLHSVSCHTPQAVTTVLNAPEDGRK